MNRRPIQRAAALLTVLAATTLVWAGVTVGKAAFGLGPAALAQQAPDGGQRSGPGGQGGRHFGKALMSLGLSEAQKTQIRQIMKDARAQNHTLTDPQQKRANMHAAFAKVEAVLTPSQRDDLQKKMQAMRGQQPQQQ